MNWKSLITKLVKSGMSEQAIANEVSRLAGRQVTQPTINRIKKGDITEPKYDIGSAIIRLSDTRKAPPATTRPSPQPPI